MATIKVTCPHCHTTYDISVKDEYFGKRVKIKCKNSQCGMEFLKDLPPLKVSDDDSTFITGAGPGKRLLKLVVAADENTKGQTFMVNQEYTVVGRRNDSGPEHRPDVAIDTTDGYMSRKHCVIQRNAQSRFSIKDNGAKNRTWLNGKPLEKMDVFFLNDGDDIKMGHTHMKVVLVEIDAPKAKNTDETYTDDDKTTM